MWVGQYPNGPSVTFLLRNVATTAELKMTGNCLKYSRPILHFDHEFTTHPHLRIVQTLLSMVFGTPKDHPKSKPFIDHIFSFFYYDGHVWFRNYQIASDSNNAQDLIEIGPRFVLYPLAIFDGYYGGPLLWKNATNIPNMAPTNHQDRKADAYRARQDAKARRSEINATLPPIPDADPLDAIFQ